MTEIDLILWRDLNSRLVNPCGGMHGQTSFREIGRNAPWGPAFDLPADTKTKLAELALLTARD